MRERMAASSGRVFSAFDPDHYHALVHQGIMSGDRVRGSAEFLREAIVAHEALYGPQDSIVLRPNSVAVLHGWALSRHDVSRRDIGRIKTYFLIAERNTDMFPDHVVSRVPGPKLA